MQGTRDLTLLVRLISAVFAPVKAAAGTCPGFGLDRAKCGRSSVVKQSKVLCCGIATVFLFVFFRSLSDLV